jgi:hypothetical protein
MAVFACGIHTDGCTRDECVQRAIAGRFALEALADPDWPYDEDEENSPSA